MNKKNTKLAFFLVFAGLVVGGISLYGYQQAEKSRAARDEMLIIQQGLLESQANGNQKKKAAEKIWISSEACKVVSGTDAVKFCKSLPEAPGMVSEDLVNLKQCAADVIRKTLDLASSDPVTDTQIRNLLCDVVDAYPSRSDNFDDVTLGQGMYHIMNDYVNKP